MSAVAKKPPGGVGRISHTETTTSPSPSPSRTTSQRNSTSTPTGHARTRSTRMGTPVSARAAAAARKNSTAAESDAHAEATAAAEDLQQRLEKEEKQSELFSKQIDVLQTKLDDAVKESATLEEKVHEYEEQLEAFTNEKREATRQIREMETIYEAERSSMLKEKEDMANKEEQMQTIIQRLKDSLAQRNHGDDDSRPSRTGKYHLSHLVLDDTVTNLEIANASPSIDGSSFAPPSSLQRSDSRNSSKLILQKDKLIESLRLDLGEAQKKLEESENQGGGHLREVERLLMEARLANARLMEDNESYQLLLKDKTLKGDFGQSDFSYMSSNQDALAALEGKVPAASSLADELSDATAAEGEGDRRLEGELKSMKEQNKALTLYINKIIERLLQHQDFESILDQSSDGKGNVNKELPPPPNGASLLQRAKSMAMGPSLNNKSKPRPISVMQASTPNSAHTDPERAPSIPIGNLGRSTSVRRSRPQSEQFPGAASLVSQMYKGPDGPLSPPLGNPRNSQGFQSGASATGNGTSRIPSTSSQAPSSAGNFPGMRSETSSISGESADITTPPSQSPPRSVHEKKTTFVGGTPRPLRLVQENADAVRDKENKRASWYTGWTGWAKKDDTTTLQQAANEPIPE
ncbi:M protein, serotype 2.1 precursor, putative [Cordyceps militaris CM01]|uniref:M protein, serotype 2.1, putative n=1 Tax=Cordyceps militaris (strain CM01) TaxID=983644 RepID=G3JGN0_CORMM|nr:M protein, serotype 2.1 precursor, putative [Cordyceps militaris CM01]EGX93299.1 M protein, serotype 2.1 precursor, putative [Cordyceps militaris CM01]